MSLLDQNLTEFELLQYVQSRDGEGGYLRGWTVKQTFMANWYVKSDIQRYVALKAEGMGQYALLTGREITLSFHNVIRRVKDGKIFRITSDSDDRYTPQSATLNLRYQEMDEWTLVDGDVNDN